MNQQFMMELSLFLVGITCYISYQYILTLPSPVLLLVPFLSVYSNPAFLFVTVGFLRSGTKLLFRRRHRQKDPSLSQSHEDVSNLGNGSAVHKKSGSFSRRLIKRFSFRSKSKGKASTNGGAGTAEH